ncbi:type I toxin-antitoxin system Hok family toxin [Escherichia coli]|nr:type I toxin-antitoxin system Hok family toxin [Escherichia coli]MBW9370376.1 type I toxin-antitoxin system Hok family toxin [Escherichia coli]
MKHSPGNPGRFICLTVIVTALVTRKDLCEVRIRTGQTEVAVFTAYEPEE